jgi:S-adenosylmethionine:tRNA ribosyltransferase-isomerase
MRLSDLDYSYPAELTATVPSRPSRVAFTAVGQAPCELTIDGLLERFGPRDLFVINESKVTPARLFSADEVEILFLRPLDGEGSEWEVLFPARGRKVGDRLTLPEGVEATLAGKGLPQKLSLSRPLTAAYFERHGEMALPPYIQAARGERHTRPEDARWYQTAWAEVPGSVAAPTASLHFTSGHLGRLAAGGQVERLTLHVGAGTFLPIRADDLAGHEMHSEFVSLPAALPEKIAAARAAGGRVWALGTTVTRALESIDRLERHGERLAGNTNLFVYPPYSFKNVDVLLTNFHQPRSSLLALVAAFAGLDTVKATYAWAVERRFKLFSYGDLSAWTRR